jgi:type IV secretory pathway VirB10-like protein
LSAILEKLGTRIISQYDNNVGFGESRVLQVWMLSEPTSAARRK